MTQITINNTESKKSLPKNALQAVSTGKFFERFLESQKMSPTKRHGLSDSAAVTFRNETCDILCHCNPHNAIHAPETTHLVVGYVQSGKTMSFTGLTALALDNGYRVVIYLAGTKNNLLDQTSKRLKKDLIGNRAKNNNFYNCLLYTSPSPRD